MKKLKKSHNSKIEQSSNNQSNIKNTTKNNKVNIETKCSRITVDNRICNEDKFNQLFSLTESIKDYKNTISQYCFDNRLLIISNVKDFLSHYKKAEFNNRYLNAWERQTIYQEITGHYAESLKRYLSKAKFIITANNLSNKNNKTKFSNINIRIETKLTKLCDFIYKNSNLIFNENNESNNLKYILDFNVSEKLNNLNEYLSKYTTELEELKLNIHSKDPKQIDNEINKEITDSIGKLEKIIISYNKLINKYTEIELYKLAKPEYYERIINLIIAKKLRLINQIKCHEYKTGTHARHLDNAQISIVEDKSNTKFKYFLKIRANNRLTGKEPKLKNSVNNKENYEELLTKYNEENFIYIPIKFNQGKLKSINRSIENIITKDFPQILIKSEQLRRNSKSRKVHIIFNYEEENKLGKLIDNNLYIEPNEDNTLGLDLNCKHNLLTDSNGNVYDGIYKNNDYLNKQNNILDKPSLNKDKLKSLFMDNVNNIVKLYSKPLPERTEKEKYWYEKLLRTNESLLKAYLSSLIKDWKKENILHLVLEDLNLLNDKVGYNSYYEHAGIKIKYSRLSRLLRLNQIKNWIASMGEKQEIFTHFINPAYSSKECSNCHCINDKNRETQELFRCVRCHNELNADHNAGINIKSRLLNKNLRYKLSEDNVYLSARSKSKGNKIYYKKVKEIIEEEYKNIAYKTYSKSKDSNAELNINNI